MIPKLDTPLKPTSKTLSIRTNGNSKSATVPNEDLMVMLKAFKVEVLSSYKAITETQAKQYQDSKADLTHVSKQMVELKAENTRLSIEVDASRARITSLESTSPAELSQTVVSQVL